MIPELGLLFLIISFVFSLVSAFILPWHLGKNLQADLLLKSSLAQRSAYLQCLFSTLSFFTLMFCFANNDFSMEYIAHNSHTQLPFLYKLCAVWGAHEGSLLLFTMILTGWMAAVAFFAKALPSGIYVKILAVLAAIQCGFNYLLLQTSNPFTRILPFHPDEGADLNPLLQDPGFVIHPPFLYLGYVGFAVPFAFAIASMLSKNAFSWEKWARPWALLAWAFLTVGIVLGSWWAYYELGWGGWWFWDPVENASFMPWLIGASLGHALLVSSKKPYFSSWSLLLAILAFILSLLGTFLVRSGVLSSVHAFASDPSRGTTILVFLTIVVSSSFLLYCCRVTQEKIPVQSSGALSRESLILLGNMIFFVATLTVLLGTLFPLVIELVHKKQLSVGPPFFNKVFIPIMLPVLLLMAVAPYLSWHVEPLRSAWRKVKKLGWVFLLIVGCFIYINYFTLFSFSALSMLALIFGCWLIFGTLGQGWSILIHPSRNILLQQKIGMLLAHAGLGISVLGMALSQSLQIEKEFIISPTESAYIDDYQLIFTDINDVHGTNYEGKRAHFKITQHNKTVCELYPEKRYFIPRNVPMTETALCTVFFKDFYIALGERFDNEKWSLRFYIKPFIRWIWGGGLLIAIGAFFSSIGSFRQTYGKLGSRS